MIGELERESDTLLIDLLKANNEQIKRVLEIGNFGDLRITAAEALINYSDKCWGMYSCLQPVFAEIKAENETLRRQLLEAIEEAYPTAT